MYLPPAELVELVCRFVVLLWFFFVWFFSLLLLRPSIDRSIDAGRQALCVSTSSHHSLTHRPTDHSFFVHADHIDQRTRLHAAARARVWWRRDGCVVRKREKERNESSRTSRQAQLTNSSDGRSGRPRFRCAVVFSHVFAIRQRTHVTTHKQHFHLFVELLEYLHITMSSRQGTANSSASRNPWGGSGLSLIHI